MILLLHEILIHLSYRYLNILTGGEINNISLKVSTNSKNNDNNNEIQIDTNSFKYDGGSFFEEILFSEKISSLSFQSFLTLLDEEYFNYSIEEFQKKFNGEFDKDNFKKKRI